MKQQSLLIECREMCTHYVAMKLEMLRSAIFNVLRICLRQDLPRREQSCAACRVKRWVKPAEDALGLMEHSHPCSPVAHSVRCDASQRANASSTHTESTFHCVAAENNTREIRDESWIKSSSRVGVNVSSACFEELLYFVGQISLKQKSTY